MFHILPCYSQTWSVGQGFGGVVLSRRFIPVRTFPNIGKNFHLGPVRLLFRSRNVLPVVDLPRRSYSADDDSTFYLLRCQKGIKHSEITYFLKSGGAALVD